MQMTKTVAGRTFLGFIGNPASKPPKPNRLRVGFITIHAGDGGSVSPNKYLKIADFDSAVTAPAVTSHASKFYTTLYAQDPSGNTPLQEALARAGWIFAGKLGTGLTSGIPAADDPIQASCQRNYSILHTDGYWNGNPGKTLDNAAIANRDNVNPLIQAPYSQPMVDRATTGTYDGSPNILVRTILTSTETQSICGVGLADTCGCTRSSRPYRIRDSIVDVTRKIVTTDGVVTSDTTTTTTTNATIGSCASGTPSFTISPNPKVTVTDTTTPVGGATAETLADVAMYYYMTDLRGGKDPDGKDTGPAENPSKVDVSANNVPGGAKDKDFANHQHMVTFTLGMADGLMRYRPDYEKLPGDFINIKNGAVGACYWAGGGVCSWTTSGTPRSTGAASTSRG
jgi:type IV pilus assembly protein PilY1